MSGVGLRGDDLRDPPSDAEVQSFAAFYIACGIAAAAGTLVWPWLVSWPHAWHNAPAVGITGWTLLVWLLVTWRLLD